MNPSENSLPRLSRLLGYEKCIDLIEFSTYLSKISSIIDSTEDLVNKIRVIKESPSQYDLQSTRNLNEQLFPHLINRQFSEKETALFELISNSLDAHARAGTDVPINIRRDKHQFSIEDRGDGIGWKNLLAYFVPSLSSNSALGKFNQPSTAKVMGRFGQGALSIFSYLSSEVISPITFNPSKNKLSILCWMNQEIYKISFISQKNQWVESKRKLMKIEQLASGLSIHTQQKGSPSLDMYFWREKGRFVFDIFFKEPSETTGTTLTLYSPLVKKLASKIDQAIMANFRYISHTKLYLNGMLINPQTPTPIHTPKALFSSGQTAEVSGNHLSFEKASLEFSPVDQQEAYQEGTLFICQERVVAQYPIFGYVPKKVAINFNHLPQTQERKTIVFTHQPTQQCLTNLVNALWKREDLSWQVKACLLNSLQPILSKEGFGISLTHLFEDPSCQNVVFLPDTQEVKQFNIPEAVYLHPSYPFKINLKPSCQIGYLSIYFINGDKGSLCAQATIKQQDYLFLNQHLFLNNPLLTQFNLKLLEHYLTLKNHQKIPSSDLILKQLYPRDLDLPQPMEEDSKEISTLDCGYFESQKDANEPLTKEGLKQILDTVSLEQPKQFFISIFVTELLRSTKSNSLEGSWEEKKIPKKLIRYLVSFLSQNQFCDTLEAWEAWKQAPKVFAFLLEDKILQDLETCLQKMANFLRQCWTYLQEAPSAHQEAFLRFIQYPYHRQELEKFGEFLSLVKKLKLKSRDNILAFIDYFISNSESSLEIDLIDQLIKKSIYGDIRKRTASLLPYLGDFQFLINLSPNDFDDLMEILPSPKSQKGTVFELLRNIKKTLTAKHYNDLILYVIRNEKSPDIHHLQATIYLWSAYLLEELKFQHPTVASYFEMDSSQFFKILDSMTLDLGAEALKLELEDLCNQIWTLVILHGTFLYTHVNLEQALQVLKKSSHDFSSTRQLVLLKFKQLIIDKFEKDPVPKLRPLILAILFTGEEGFAGKLPLLPSLPENLYPLHEDPEVISRIGTAHLAKERIDRAVSQNLTPYFCLGENIKNSKEAGATEIEISPHIGPNSEWVVILKDNGAGMEKEHVVALKTPGKTTKTQSGDFNFGWGFFSNLNAFDEVHVVTQSKSTPGKGFKIYFKKNLENQIVEFQQKEEPISQAGTTLILIKRGVFYPLIELIKLKSYVMSSCHIPDIEIKWIDSLSSRSITQHQKVETVLEHHEPYFVRGFPKSTIEIRLSKPGQNGLYCKGIKMSRMAESSWRLVPKALRGILEKEGVGIDIYLPPYGQLMNRGHVAETEALESTIQIGLFKAAVNFCRMQWEKGRHFDLLPTDYFDNFSSFKDPDFSDNQDLVNLFEKPHGQQNEELLLQDFGENLMQKQGLKLASSLTFEQAEAYVQAELSKKSRLSIVEWIKPLVEDERELWSFLTLLPLGLSSSSLSLANLRENIQEILDEEVLDEMGEYDVNSFEESELLEKIDKEISDSELEEYPEALIKQFKEQIKEALRLRFNQVNRDKQMKLTPELIAIESFLKMLAKRVLNLDLQVIFYQEADGAVAHVKRGEASKIYINLTSRELASFQSFYALSSQGFEKALNQEMRTILRWIDTLCHELSHLDEGTSCGTHDQMFNHAIANKMKEFLIWGEGQPNHAVALLKAAVENTQISSPLIEGAETSLRDSPRGKKRKREIL